MRADCVELVDSTRFVGNPDELRRRAGEHGYLWLRGIPGPEPVAPLRAFVQEIGESLGLFGPASHDRGVSVARPGAALAGTGYEDPRWLALQERVLIDPRFVAVGDCAQLLGVLEALFEAPVLTRRGDICRVVLPQAEHLTTPPHQDHWYTGGTTNLWTVWIPLGETSLDLGPLAVLPGSHVKGLQAHAGHGAGRQGVRVPDTERFAFARLAAGDAILFNSLTVHRALPNVTRDRVRLSVDYRYQPANEPILVVRVNGTRAGI